MNAIDQPTAAADTAAPFAERRLVLVLRQPGAAPAAGELRALGLDARVLGMPESGAPDTDALAGADAIVVEAMPGAEGGAAALAAILQLVDGQIPVIAAIPGLNVDGLRRALHLGAADALALPFSPPELRQAVDALAPALQRARPAAASAPRRKGRVISFMGAIGGVGNSSIATQSGILWAENARTCYVDFDMQFGNAALLLDLRPALHIGHLIDDVAGMDGDLLQSVAAIHDSGLSLIASPTEMMPIEVIDRDFVDRLLSVARDNYDIVIADLPTLWSEWTMRILQRSDCICMVTDLSVPSLYQARRQLEMVDANGLTPKLKVIANRVQKGMFAKVNLKETEGVLGRRIEFSIANDYPAVSAANDQGRAVRDVRPGSRVLKDLAYLSSTLAATLMAEGGAA